MRTCVRAWISTIRIDATAVIDKVSKELRIEADSSEHLFPLSKSSKDFGIVVAPTDGLLGYVARTGISINIPDAQMDPRFNKGLDATLQ